MLGERDQAQIKKKALLLGRRPAGREQEDKLGERRGTHEVLGEIASADRHPVARGRGNRGRCGPPLADQHGRLLLKGPPPSHGAGLIKRTIARLPDKCSQSSRTRRGIGFSISSSRSSMTPCSTIRSPGSPTGIPCWNAISGGSSIGGPSSSTSASRPARSSLNSARAACQNSSLRPSRQPASSQSS